MTEQITAKNKHFLANTIAPMVSALREATGANERTLVRMLAHHMILLFFSQYSEEDAQHIDAVRLEKDLCECIAKWCSKQKGSNGIDYLASFAKAVTVGIFTKSGEKVMRIAPPAKG